MILHILTFFYDIYNEIILIHLCKRDNQAALSFCNELLLIEQKIPSINPLKQASIYNNIASVYCSAKNYQAALDILEKVQNIQQEHYRTNHLLAYATHMNFQEALKALHKHSEANEHAERACEIAREFPEIANL